MDKTDLKRYRFLCKKLNLLREEHRRALDQAYPHQVLDGMPHTTNTSDSVGKLAAKRADIIRDYEEIETSLMSKKMEIENLIDGLDDPRESVLLRLYYINGKTWQDVADEMGYSASMIFKLHKNAMRIFMH
jgi:RNA polymerase sigma factor (sigma-70 family)